MCVTQLEADVAQSRISATLTRYLNHLGGRVHADRAALCCGKSCFAGGLSGSAADIEYTVMRPDVGGGSQMPVMP
ncbi:hypothetical protein thsrh120_42120 [Rhizobium sp. No.120]